MSLRIVDPGVCSLIVDGGRPGTRSLGVPCGGPADRSAWALGNAMLGNPPGAAALEMTLAGATVQALANTGMVVFGAPFALGSGRRRLVANQSFTLNAGEELHIGGTRWGACGSLCVVGGLQTRLILGSRCGLAPVRRGDELVCGTSSCQTCHLQDHFDWPLVPTLGDKFPQTGRTLRVLPGPEADWFGGCTTVASLSEASNKAFTVRPESNRMGLRLTGPPLPVPQTEMVSQPVAPGAVQVTRDGQLIMLGVDGQTIGGYPRIAHVISADLDLLGQLRPGDQVRFQLVTLDEAERLARMKRTLLEGWCLRLREAATAF